jgi:hypothetical protein
LSSLFQNGAVPVFAQGDEGIFEDEEVTVVEDDQGCGTYFVEDEEGDVDVVEAEC